MTRHRYAFRSLLPDYLRAGIGLLFTGALLLFAAPASVMLWLLAACAAMFLGFGLQTLLRQATVFELSASGIRALNPLGAAINWEELRDVDVRYYSTRRDRSNGWMQITLRGKGRPIRVDSSVTDFAHLARVAVAAAEARGVSMSPSSRTNLRALGIHPIDDPFGAEGRPVEKRK